MGDLEKAYAKLARDCASSYKMWFVYGLETTSRLETRHLREALLLHVQRKHGLLRCVMTEDYVWEYRPEVRVVVREIAAGQEEQGARERVFRTEVEGRVWDYRREVPIRAYLIRYSDHVVDIGLEVEHLVGQGLSMCHLMHAVLEGCERALARGSGRDGEEEKEAHAGWEPPRFPVPLEVATSVSFPNPIAKSLARLYAFARYLLIFASHQGGRNLVIAPTSSKHDRRVAAEDLCVYNTTHAPPQCVLDEAETKRLIHKCREKKVTVTTAVTSAFLHAFARLAERDGEGRWEGTMDAIGRRGGRLLSRLLPKRRFFLTQFAVDFGNGYPKLIHPSDMSACIGGVEPFLFDLERDGAGDDDVWSYAATLRAGTQAQRGRFPLYALIQAMVLNTLMPNTSDGLTLFVSSWGADNPTLPSYGAIAVKDGEMYQNNALTTFPILNVYTVCGRLHLRMMAAIPRYDEVTLREMFEAGVAEVRRTMLAS